MWVRHSARYLQQYVWRSYPSYVVRNLPRALRPVTHHDHLRRKMLFDRRPIMVTFADKTLAREHVRAKIGDHVLTRAYAITDDVRTIDWAALPRTYVCKATHGSGGVIVVTEDADPGVTLPPPEEARWRRFFIHPDRATPEAITAIGQQWLRTRFGWGAGSTHEWQYRDLTPRILIEELLQGPDGGLAADTKLFVFHGRCELVTVVRDRMHVKRTDRFRPDWTRVQIAGAPPPPEVEVERPANLDEMIRIAETLGADTDFVRVDLYDLGDRIVFGELTNTPNAARGKMDAAYDRMLGAYWRVGRAGVRA